MKGDVRIAIVAPIQPEDFFDQLWQGVWEATFDLASFGVQVHNLTTKRYDVDGQRVILEQLFDESVDAISILPAHGSALNDLIDRHESARTPVITFYGDAPESRRSAFVGPDPYQAWQLAGEILSKLMGNRGRIICVPGSEDQYHIAQRYQGFQAQAACSSGAISEQAAPFELDQFASAGGVYVGDEDLVQVATALNRAGIHVPCVGFGNTELARPLLAGQSISAVIDESRFQQGYFAVQKAYQAVLARQAGASLTGVRIPSFVVFATNAADTGDSLQSAFEMVVRQRTEVLFRYKQRLEQANAELVSLSNTDPLTNLLNRRKFEEVINNEVARARRYGPLSLLMIDLNNFKQVNDQHGHQTGDELLKAVAKILKTCCRSTDTCVRLGGDEFAVILPHTDSDAAGIVRDRINRDVRRTRLPIGGRELSFSVSIGVASMPNDATDAESLRSAADTGMYRVKQEFKLKLDPVLA